MGCTQKHPMKVFHLNQQISHHTVGTDNLKEMSMSSFAIVSFDLVNATSSDYTKIRDELKRYGLGKSVLSSQGSNVRLPSTTYAGEFQTTPTTQQLKDWLFAAAKVAVVKIGDYFILSTSGGWSWMGGSSS
jgi:hypothetical protein